jgi:hypothetical protein
MRLYLDIDTREFLQSPSFPRALTTLSLKRRDTDLLELQFLRDRIIQELPTGTTIRLGLKPSAAYTADFLASGTFTKSGTGTSTKYLLDLNLNTVALNAAFAAATPEPETLAAMLEVEWASGSNISSSLTLPVTIANDVIRGDEGEPADVPLFYTSATSDLKATQAQAETGTDNTQWMTPLRVVQTLTAKIASFLTWANITGKPSTFPPSSHTHAVSEISTLQSLLDAKAASSHTHAAADITSGILDIARIPTGTASGTVATGNHTHTLGNLTQSGAATGQVALWNGTAWVPSTPSSGNSITQQVTSITGTSNHNLTANSWHIFVNNQSSGNHTFTLPQNATNGDLVYITFLNSSTTGFQVLRFGYEGGNPQVVAGSFETGKTYLFHYNDFDTARWRKVTFA